MSLEAELQLYRRQIATDAYPMSIGELSNLYRDKELEIHPEFQRIFRWTDTQKTRLIESILLGIPMPSIFVAQNEDGIWDIVDGVQRLSTIFQFMGILRDENDSLVEPLVCSEGPFLTSMKGLAYEDSDISTSTLDSTQRLDFKRARIDVKIIKRESDRRAKYDLFQRLNSYGSTATVQELRNCLLVSMSREHFYWLTELAEDDDFKSVIDLPERLIEEQYHTELALRFITLRKIEAERLSRIGNIGEFLTEQLVPLSEFSKSELAAEAAVFHDTFSLLRRAGGPALLRRKNIKNERSEGPFSLTAFETLALPIGYYDAAPEITIEIVQEKQNELWSRPDFKSGFSTGQRADQRMRRTIPLGRELFATQG